MTELDKLVAQRRRGWGDAAADPDVWGLALSGGGIRSATFCFGLLQALARHGLLRRFDLLSTVSGGGYIGAMLGRLFSRATSQADAARIAEALGDARGKWFTWWLRANGRYLIPRGAHDTLFAVALYLRNLLGVHFELGLLALLAGSALAGINGAAWGLLDAGAFSDQWQAHAFAVARAWPAWLPVVSLLALPVAAAALVLTTAYWCIGWMEGERDVLTLRPLAAVIGGALVLAVGIALQPGWHLGSAAPAGEATRFLLWATGAALLAGWLAAVVLVWAMLQVTARDGDIAWRARMARSRVTRWLATCLRAAAAVAVLCAIDRSAWYLAFEFESAARTGLALALAAALLRAVLPAAGKLVPGALSTRALLAAARVAGYLLAYLLASWWVSLVYRAALGALFVPGAARPFEDAAQVLAWIALPVLGYLLVTGRNLEFLNLSSLHGFYRARLTRSYLGAANARRFNLGGALDLLNEVPPPRRETTRVRAVADLDADDDIAFADYRPHEHGGPVHIINVCVNQTRDPRGGLFNQDRRGLLLSVASGGLHRVSQEAWKPLPRDAEMTLGSWTAISGAAVAPGLGHLTRGGISALATFAGVRLGYWWQRLSGRRGHVPRGWLAKSAGVLRETLGIFRGTERADWFLTDGGHFENTGAYALLAERARFIVVADCGADPDYAFSNLEDLVRKARIDLQADIDFMRPIARLQAADGSRSVPAQWRSFGSLADLASAHSTACLAVARVRYAGDGGEGLLVIVKPSICEGLPVDLLNFKAANPQFPQQPTADQFFSEAQWDAYFELGSFIGSKLEPQLVATLVREHADWFEPDQAALATVQAKPGDGQRLSALARGPARLAAASAAGATLSLGAAATLGVSVWQALDGVRTASTKQTEDERAALKELAVQWGKLPAVPPQGVAAASAASSPPASDVAALATSVVRYADTLCPKGEEGWFTGSVVARAARQDALHHCIATPAAARPAACRMLIEAEHPRLVRRLPDCLAPASLDEHPRRPRYGYRDYGPLASDADAHPCDAGAADRRLAEEELKAAWRAGDTAFWTAGRLPQPSGPAPECRRRPLAERPPALPVASTAAAAVSPWLRACDAGTRPFTVFTQIYGPAQRDQAEAYRDRWAVLGVNAAPVQDVWASARAAGRAEPLPFAETTVRYADAPALACAQAMQASLGLSGWRFEPLPAAAATRPGQIDVWLAPTQPALPPPPPSAPQTGDAPAVAAEIARLAGPERRAASARLTATTGDDRAVVVRQLLAALLADDKPLGYRVNLYVAHTLATMRGRWPASRLQYDTLAALKQSANYLRDPTFRQRVDAALANADITP